MPCCGNLSLLFTGRQKRSSIVVDDSYLRDALLLQRSDSFESCHEGGVNDDHLFVSMTVETRQQVWLKTLKAKLLARAFFIEFRQRWQRICCRSDVHRRRSIPLSAQSGHMIDGNLLNRFQSLREDSNDWFGQTLRERTSEGLPTEVCDACWQNGGKGGLEVRCGPNYPRNRRKTTAGRSMYDCISCDAIRSSTLIEDVVGRLITTLPEQTSEWNRSCGLPRVICINLKLPYSMGSDDPGCNFVCMFRIRDETVREASSERPSAHIRLLRAFFQGSAGSPGCPRDHPSRSLARRLGDRKKDLQSGLFKVIARCENTDKIRFPFGVKTLVDKFNGKPTVIEKSGYIIKDPDGEWAELGIDIRGFAYVARKLLLTSVPTIEQARIHFGFLIQAVDDDDLPESLIGDMFAFGINTLTTPLRIDN